MLKAWRDEYRQLPDPPLWRALVFAGCLLLLAAWPLLKGEAIGALRAALIVVVALAVVHDLARLAWLRMQRG